MPDLLSIYHKLPYPLRVLAVSAQGYLINRWRYDSKLEKRVEEAIEREQWSAQKWQEWQEEKLARMLRYAATRVPYYQTMWAERRRRGDRSSWEMLENWPILSKDTLRQNPDAFLSQDNSKSQLMREWTGGTTGTPLQLWAGRETMQEWYALSEARWRRWYGVSDKSRWANIGVRPVVPYNATHPPFWVWNAAMRQLYLSSLHIKPEFLHDYVTALRDYRIDYLYGYPSGYFWLARYMIDQGENLPLKVVVTSSENLFDFQRDAMEQAFQCHVRETYGQSEKITAAGECEHGRLHLWPEVGYTEFLPPDPSLSEPHNSSLSRMICTTLINRAMPLIRYDILDLVEQPASSDPCTCGRGLPVLGKVLGRYEDTVLTTDGRRVGHLVGFLSSGAPVKEIQVVQESLKHVTVKVVAAQDWSREDEKLMTTRLKTRIGDCDVKVELVSEIERAKSGKFQAVISKISPTVLDPDK